MSHSHDSSKPPDLDPLLHQISQAHSSPDNESLTEAAIIASVNYLQKLPQEIHWLCNSSPLLTVVVQAIQLWGYGEPPAQATLAKFKPLLAKELSRCSDCAIEWHSRVRRELRRVFLEVYSYDEESTSDFYSVLEEWDGDRVQAALENALQGLEKIFMPWKHIEVKCPLVECLSEPTLLLKEERFRTWKKLFSGLEKMPAGVGDKWMPGAMVLLFDSDTRIREFGQLMFKKREEKIGNEEFDSSLRKALEILVKRDSEKVSS
jgi:SEN1 N terminal